MNSCGTATTGAQFQSGHKDAGASALDCSSLCFRRPPVVFKSLLLLNRPTSVGGQRVLLARPARRFSPLHEGDTSVARDGAQLWMPPNGVSVPFTRGTPPWLRLAGAGLEVPRGFSPLHEGDTSVAKFG